MSTRDQIKTIVDRIPDDHLNIIFTIVKSIDEDAADDAFCEALYQNYLNDPDPEKEVEYSIEDCKKEWEIAWPI